MVALGYVPSVSGQVAYNIFPAAAPLARTAPSASHDSTSLVSLTVKDSTIAYVIQEIARQGHMRAVYRNSDSVFANRISVRIVNASFWGAMTIALKGTGLMATVTSDGETAVVRRKTTGKEHGDSASGSVNGRVTDSASGRGLSGATVKVQGTKISAVTSDSGQFTLRNVPAGDRVLSVRLFGYKPDDRTVPVVSGERATVHIVLVAMPTVLSGVVTTAVGQQPRYQVGSDITVLRADSIQNIAPVTNLTQMLETRVPGLVVQHTSGIPGAPSRLRLRGISSINSSSDPILIVDGVRVYADQSGSVNPITKQTSGGGSQVSGLGVGGTSVTYAGPSALDQIDPNSIETIEVLKGPSATAIYGSDAAAGVIVITTKHGRAGPTHWNLALDQSRTTLPGTWPTNFYRFCGRNFDGFGSNSFCNLEQEWDNGFDVAFFPKPIDSVVSFQALNESRYSPLTGQPGQNRDGSLTVSGGSGGLSYSVTGSAATQDGYLHLPIIERQRFAAFHGLPAPGWMVDPDQYSTYGETSQLYEQFGKSGSTIGLTSSLFHSAQQQSSLQNDLAGLSGMFVDTTQLAESPLFPNYYQRAQLATTTFNNAVAISNLSTVRWLPLLNATVGVNVQDLNNHTLVPSGYITCKGNTSDGQCATDSLGNYALTQGNNTTASLMVGTTFGQRRIVSTALGMNLYTQDQSNVTESTIGLPLGVSVPNELSQPGTLTTANTATYGWYVQPTLNFQSRFFVSPGFRLDGGSASGSHASYSGGGVSGLGGGGLGALSLFPKLDFSWIAVQRTPSNPLFGLTLLRPRIAFGIAGVQPGPAEQLRLLTPLELAPITSSGASAPMTYLTINTLGNTKLHPERDEELEGGIDAQFWNQRLSLTLTGYHKLAVDAIIQIPVAPSVDGGWTNTVNIGNILNTGIETTVGARLLDSRLVSWSLDGNFSRNTNKLVSLAPGQSAIVTDLGGGVSNRITPGFPIDAVWTPPIVSFSDANHDGIIAPNEIVVGDSAHYVGQLLPNYEMTFSTTVALFNDRVNINTSVDYQNGLTQNLTSTNVSQLLNTPGLTPGQQAAFFAVLAEPASAIGQLQTANTLRWNTLSVNVVLPPSIARWFRAPNMNVALQGQNLGLHTNYRGKDPNVNVFSSGNQTADDGNALPQPRVWSVRVNLTN